MNDTLAPGLIASKCAGVGGNAQLTDQERAAFEGARQGRARAGATE